MDIVFEESEPQQQQMDDGSMSSPSLNFLRHKVSFPSHYTSNTSEAPSFSIPAVRRARAGTMPSFVQQPSDSNRSTHSSLLLTAIESGRHRSGSLNLPPVDPSYWGLTSDGPLSPSSEQLLQNDNDFSIARTMRSLGLEEHGSSNGSNGNNGNNATTNGNGSGGLFHHPTPPEFLMPSRSLLSGNNRNRSYSVNATARYETEPPPVSRATPVNYMGSLEGFGRQQQNRPRASSMGRADNMSLSMGMWGNGIQRSSPLGSMREEYEQDGQTSLSLGDSELLANMINNNNNNNNTIYEQNDSQHHHHHHQPDNVSSNNCYIYHLIKLMLGMHVHVDTLFAL